MNRCVAMRRVPGVRQTILIIAMVIAQFGRAADKKSKIVPNITKAKAAIEKEIRKRANKPTGELTKADLEKETNPVLEVTDVRVIAKLTQLRRLWLKLNPNLTKGKIDELQRALPKCEITHDFE